MAKQCHEQEYGCGLLRVKPYITNIRSRILGCSLSVRQYRLSYQTDWPCVRTQSGFAFLSVQTSISADLFHWGFVLNKFTNSLFIYSLVLVIRFSR